MAIVPKGDTRVTSVSVLGL